MTNEQVPLKNNWSVSASSITMKTGRINTPGYVNQGIEVIQNNPLSVALNPGYIGFALSNTSQSDLWDGGSVILTVYSPFNPCGSNSRCPGMPSTVSNKVGIGLDKANRPYVYQVSWQLVQLSPCCRYTPVTTVWQGSTNIHFATWNYFELNCSTYELRLNGNTEVTTSSPHPTYPTDLSGGAPASTTIEWGVTTLGGSIRLDDICIQDSSGSFLGDSHVDTLYPTADGTYTQWTPDTSGAAHYSRVDEPQMDDNISYNSDDTPGDKDSFVMQDLPYATGTVLATQLNLGAKKNESATHTVEGLIRESGTDHTSSAYTLSANWDFYSWLMQTDPAGGSWTIANVNADECGIETVS